MANYREVTSSTHRCSVPGCTVRGSFKIAKSMGRTPLYICRTCMEHVAGAFAKLFPEEFEAKFAAVEDGTENVPPQSPEGDSSPEGGAAGASDSDEVELTEESLKTLKRAELDKLLVERGLDPKDYANKGECVKALLANTSSTTDAGVGDPPSPAGEGSGETA